MAPFYPLYIRRSDGKSEISTKTGKELNEPLPEQLDSKPNAQGISDFYRECLPGEPKEIDWRRKLGGMLIREIGGSDTKNKQFILAALPVGYRVYEHVKCKVQDDKNPEGAKPSKSHAAGGNERQDAYLYGHPFGRKKRYRSPAEFFPHLLWLATDAEGDSNNCSCKFCSPEELESEEKEKPQAKAATVAAAVATKETKQESPAAATDVAKQPAETTSTKATGTTKPIATAAPKRAISQSQPLQQAQPVQLAKPASPQPLPQAIRMRSREQSVDAVYNKFFYRPGEIVWFSRVVAWGLALIMERQLIQTQNGEQVKYQVQPLSHPFSHPHPAYCRQEDLRPWLAWSPPPCTFPDLNPTAGNSNRVLMYSTIDWNGVLEGKYGQGDPEVDGSIMAVKQVETTFTLFDRIESKASTSGNSQTSEIYYNGIYLGAEKIWLGDPLRVRNGSHPSNILVLTSIVERPNLQDSSRPNVVLTGDIYSLQLSNLDPEGATKAKQMEQSLPMRVREDLAVHNRITLQNSRPYFAFWKLTTTFAQVNLDGVKGRWYESSLFMPILDPDTYAKNRANGEVSDTGQWMNAQGDCNKSPGENVSRPKPAEIKTRRREDAFLRSIPPDTKISRGFDDPDYSQKQQRLMSNTGKAAATATVNNDNGQRTPSAHAPTVNHNNGSNNNNNNSNSQQQQAAAFSQFINIDQQSNAAARAAAAAAAQGQAQVQTQGQAQDYMHNFRIQQQQQQQQQPR